ncbi:MAG: GNAT family N-acetyltransferase [Acidobacteria bacterium]|nr:GNAT family N-acetyltransferase [Acidobacteriota bacterium]
MRRNAITIQRAQPDELEWVNARYQEVQFMPSQSEDWIVIARVDGLPAGLGRIVPINSAVGELGGMVVLPEFQGLGLANAIIQSLLEHSPFSTLYCLPFVELRDLYGKFGFKTPQHMDQIPNSVREKHAWCNQTYAKSVLLLERLDPCRV